MYRPILLTIAALVLTTGIASAHGTKGSLNNPKNYGTGPTASHGQQPVYGQGQWANKGPGTVTGATGTTIIGPHIVRQKTNRHLFLEWHSSLPLSAGMPTITVVASDGTPPIQQPLHLETGGLVTGGAFYFTDAFLQPDYATKQPWPTLWYITVTMPDGTAFTTQVEILP